MIGKGGLIPISSTRVLGRQTSLRSRKFGDAKMTDRHLQQQELADTTSKTIPTVDLSRLFHSIEMECVKEEILVNRDSGSLSFVTQPAHGQQ